MLGSGKEPSKRPRGTGRDLGIDVDLCLRKSVEGVDGQQGMSKVVQNAEKQDDIELLSENLGKLVDRSPHESDT